MCSPRCRILSWVCSLKVKIFLFAEFLGGKRKTVEFMKIYGQMGQFISILTEFDIPMSAFC